MRSQCRLKVWCCFAAEMGCCFEAEMVACGRLVVVSVSWNMLSVVIVVVVVVVNVVGWRWSFAIVSIAKRVVFEKGMWARSFLLVHLGM